MIPVMIMYNLNGTTILQLFYSNKRLIKIQVYTSIILEIKQLNKYLVNYLKSTLSESQTVNNMYEQ